MSMTNIYDMPKYVKLRATMVLWGLNLSYLSIVLVEPSGMKSFLKSLDVSSRLRECIKARSEGAELN